MSDPWPLSSRLLAPVVVLAGMVELSLNRILTVELRPAGDQVPGMGHRVLDAISLFTFNAATCLAAICVVAGMAKSVRSRRGVVPKLLVIAGASVLAYSLLAVLGQPDHRSSLLLRGSFALFVALHLLLAWMQSGTIRDRVGLTLLSIPLLFAALPPIVIALAGDSLLYSTFPERMAGASVWIVIAVSIAIPFTLGPRPLQVSLRRRLPMVMAVFVGLLAAALIRSNMEQGVALARLGLGIDLAIGMTQWKLILAVIALVAVTWTIFACVTAASPGRRDIGVGVATVVIAGYAFDWPLAFLLASGGLLTLSESLSASRDEEQKPLHEFTPPPIPPEL